MTAAAPDRISAGEQRWNKVRDDLAAAGIDGKVFAKSYQELRWGRPHFGVSRSIAIRLPAGMAIEIRDSWWRKNPDTWTGYQADLVGADSIVKATMLRTKKRSDVVAWVLEQHTAVTR